MRILVFIILLSSCATHGSLRQQELSYKTKKMKKEDSKMWKKVHRTRKFNK